MKRERLDPLFRARPPRRSNVVSLDEARERLRPSPGVDVSFDFAFDTGELRIEIGETTYVMGPAKVERLIVMLVRGVAEYRRRKGG